MSKFNTFFVVFLVIIFVSLGAYYVVRIGYYPVAFVNARIITARAFNEEYLAAYQYYKQVIVQEDVKVDAGEFKNEVQRLVLKKLIDDLLVNSGLKAVVGSCFEDIVHQRISGLNIDNKEFADSVLALYGMEVDDFKKIVLIPRAEREALEARLLLKNTKLDDWLKEARKLARVNILLPSFSWNGGDVVRAQE